MSNKINDQFSNSLDWFRSYRFSDIDLPLPQEKQPSHLWATKFVRWFWELCLKRLKELIVGYYFAKKRNKKLIMALCARAALETFALEMFHIIKLETLSQEGKWEDFYKLCEKLHLGYRDEANKEKIKAKNILDYIDTYDRYMDEVLLKAIGNYSMRQIYNDLSNICHPNWLGLGYLYMKSNRKIVQNDPIFTAFEIIIVLAQYHDEHVKKLEQFSAGIYRKGTIA